ncbi:MAG TPA: ATP-binding protein [Bacteroidales bacterium]|nr:ATP-binding protein [Bacteroidales bacterium]
MKEIAVVSGKGGTGKSSISAAFATLGSPIMLADCDVDAANLYLLFEPEQKEEIVYIGGNKAVVNHSLCNMCRICVTQCRFDAISAYDNRIVINETSCDGCFLCSRICPEGAIRMEKSDKSRLFAGSFRNGQMVYGRLAPGEENSGKLVSMVREKAKSLAKENNLDTIILDGPPGIGCPVISTLTGVSRVVIVTEPTISGFHDMTRIIEIVQKFKIQPLIIINKFDLNQEMADEISEWCNQKGIVVVGCLPFSVDFVDAMVQQKSIIEYNNNTKISDAIRLIYNKIIKY